MSTALASLQHSTCCSLAHSCSEQASATLGQDLSQARATSRQTSLCCQGLTSERETEPITTQLPCQTVSLAGFLHADTNGSDRFLCTLLESHCYQHEALSQVNGAHFPQGLSFGLPAASDSAAHCLLPGTPTSAHLLPPSSFLLPGDSLTSLHPSRLLLSSPSVVSFPTLTPQRLRL